MIAKVLGFITGAQGSLSLLPILLIVFLGGFIFHERLASKALSEARNAGMQEERAKWEQAQREAEILRTEERRRAESKIRALETETAALRGSIEAQEAELEHYIQDQQARRPDRDGASTPLLERGLVRQLNRQGRPADQSPAR